MGEIKYKPNYEDAYVRATPKHLWRGITKSDCEDLLEQIKRHCDIVDVEIVHDSQWETEDGKTFNTKAEAIIHELNHPDFDSSDADDSPTYHIKYKSFSDKGTGTSSYVHLFSEVIEEAYRSPVDFIVTCDITERQQELIDQIILMSCKKNITKVNDLLKTGKVTPEFVEKYGIDIMCSTHDFNII